MQTGYSIATAVAIALMTFATRADAADETISTWTLLMTPVVLSMDVGDVLTWNSFSAPHTAHHTPAGFCDFTGATQLDSGGTGASFTFTSAGTYYFGCFVSGHCTSGGMSATITVTAPAVAPALSVWSTVGIAILFMGVIEVARQRRSSRESS